MSMFATARHGCARFRRTVMMAFAALLLAPSSQVLAGCDFSGNAPDVVFNPPATITVPFDTPVGAVIYESSQTAPMPVESVTCYGSTRQGLENRTGGGAANGSAIFPTGVPGVGYRLLHGSNSPSDYMYPWACCTLAGGTYNFSVTTALQLIKTGTITDGARLNQGQLAQWMHDKAVYRFPFWINSGTVSLQDYILGNRVTFVSPACRLNTPDISVTLPAISNRDLPSTGSTAGATPFRINLTCRSGAALRVTFDAAPPTGVAGVIANQSGTGRATGVGVQLTRSNASPSPIEFGEPISEGATRNGAVDLNYIARYYRTASVTPGTVSAKATFTLTYE